MAYAKCPVCGWDMQDGGIELTVAGRQITVYCDECAQKAKADPEAVAGAAR